jgi:hypothetical protein
VSTPETPSARRTSKVRWNLLPEFANSTDLQVCDTPEVDINVTTPVLPETELSFYEMEGICHLLDFTFGDMCISDCWILSFVSDTFRNTSYAGISISNGANSSMCYIAECYLENLLK